MTKCTQCRGCGYVTHALGVDQCSVCKGTGYIEQASRATPAGHRVPVAIIPRRPLNDDQPDGYLESDRDFVENNLDAAVWMLENATPADHIVDANKKVDSESVPVATLHDDGYYTWNRKVDKPYGYSYAGWRMEVYATPQAPHPEAQSVQDAVIEECAKLVDEFANGATEESTQFALDVCSDVVRNLKSAPPQKPEDAS